MSHRLPASLLLAVLLLLVVVPLGLAPAAAAFGERTYESNEVVNPANLDVFSGQSVAQSFVPTDTYRLLRVTLRLQNTGSTTDAVNVSIRQDAGARPADAFVAATNVVSGGAITLVNVSFASEPVLARGSRYWIVATHPGPLTESYRWYHSNGNTYGGGWAMVNLNLGAGWTNTTTPTDMYFSTYGRELEANLTVRLAAPSEAKPKDLVTYAVYYNNTGSQEARRAWVNVSLPAGLTYASDTATSSLTSFPRFTFVDVANGVRSFNVAARVDVGIEPGTVLLTAASLDYVNATWVPRPGSTAQAAVIIGNAVKELYLVPRAPVPDGLTPLRPTGGAGQQVNLTLKKGDPPREFDLLQPLSRSFRASDLTVVLFLDSSSNNPEDLNLNLTLADWNGVTLDIVAWRIQRARTNAFDDFQRFTFPFDAFDHVFAPGHRIRLRVAVLGNSTQDGVLAFNSTFADSRLELTTTTYVRVDVLELRDLAGVATDWSSKDALVMRANVSDPLGSPEIVGARVTVTAPSGSIVVNDVAMTLIATDPSALSAWKVFEHAYGPPLVNGTYRIEVVAQERNGVVDVAAGTALVRSPLLTAMKVATAPNVRSGDRFFYRIYVNNTGTAPAGTVWLNDTLPLEVLLVSNSDPANQTGSANWTWTNVAPGGLRLDLEVEVRSGIPPTPFFRNTATVEFADQKGHRWPRLTASVDTVLNGPVIALTKAADRAGVHAGEDVTFTISMANTGDTAQALWLNDTLPSGLIYVSNSADTIGGTTTFSGGIVRIQFANMPAATTWTFDLVARAATGLDPGAALTNRADLVYTNSNGAIMPPRTTTSTVTVLAPRVLSAAIFVNPARPVAGDRVQLMIDFANSGNEPAPSLWVNLSLDPLLIFRDASEAASVSGSVVRFALSNVAVGPRRVYLNVTVATSAEDGRSMGVAGSVEYVDAIGNGFPRVTIAPAAVTASGPRILLAVNPGVATAEAGTTLTLTISLTNAGSGAAGDLWLNLSLPATFVYVSDTSDGTRTVAGTTRTWHWSNAPPGPRSFVLWLVANEGLADGTGANLTFLAEYTDTNANLRAAPPWTVRVSFVAPTILLDVQADRTEALPGDTVTFVLRMQNAGSMPAKAIWLVNAVDGRFEIVSYTSRVRADGSPALNWTFADVLPGQEEVIVLVLRVAEGLPARTTIANVLEAYFTNSVGEPIGYARSVPRTLVVVADVMPLVYIVVGGLAIGAVPILIMIRRHGVTIEEVFLVYRDGVLMYHVSRSLVEDKDEDVLSGMLTAVQEFVRDAFRYGEHRQLHRLDFGDYRILIERGQAVYLAVVYSGYDTPVLRKRVRAVLDRIEVAYADVLQRWDGDMDRIVGAREMIRDILMRPTARPRMIPKAG